MPESIIGPVAGALVGGLMSDSGGGQQQTQNREPWKPTQQALTDLVGQGQALGNYYQQNPFNAPQQQSYQNLFGDIDAFRSQLAPGLMGFANQLMGTTYKRAPAGTERMGLLGGQGGMPAQGARPAFSVPQGGAYGALNWSALNPQTAIDAQQQAKKPAAQPDEIDKMVQDAIRRQQEQEQARWWPMGA